MTTWEVLRGASQLIERGWSEPLSISADGFQETWSVFDAIVACATEPKQAGAAWRLLEHVALPANANLDAAFAAFPEGATAEEVVEAARVPGANMQLQDWLESPKRKLEEVIAALDTASLRARMLGE